jgi:nicotinate-nucleotide adenylyltransferase
VVKLGVLGGTFDPIHNDHLAIARRAYEVLGLDQVLLVPAGTPPHKANRSVTAAEHRLKMVELAIAADPCLAVSTVDVDRPGPHYSCDTVDLLRAQYQLQTETCFFIIGSDSLIDLPTWHAPEKLLALCYLAVIRRPGYQVDISDLAARLPPAQQRLVWVEMAPNSISATLLRRQLRQGQSVEGLLPPAVLTYIQTQELYS